MSDGGEGKTPPLDLDVLKERLQTIREALPATGSTSPYPVELRTSHRLVRMGTYH
jgi:hypothetical protein